jgi:hypothetical protein
MLHRFRFVLATVGAFILGNAICAILLASANEHGSTSIAQSVSLFRDIYNTTDITLFIITFILAIFDRSSPEE